MRLGSGPPGGPRRPGGKVLVAAGACAAGAIGVAAAAHSHRQRHLQQQEHLKEQQPRSIKLHPSIVEAFAGAVGEVVQVAVLYPLDTIKVRCQANSMMSSEVVRDLVATSRASPLALLRALYAGCAGAMLCSVLVGAVHFSSYEASKRFLFQKLVAPPTPPSPAGSPSHLSAITASLAAVISPATPATGPTATGAATTSHASASSDDRASTHAAASSSSSSGCAPPASHATSQTGAAHSRSRRRHDRGSNPGPEGCQQPQPDAQQQAGAALQGQQLHQGTGQQEARRGRGGGGGGGGGGGTPGAGPDSGGRGQPGGGGGQQRGGGGQPGPATAAAAEAAAAAAAAGDHHDDGPPLPLAEHSRLLDEAMSVRGPDRLAVNVCASVFTALATALVESPVELFRHNQQAGMVQGNFLREMARAVRSKGPIAGLYWGFLPHCFEACPHDMSEMLVMGCMKDMHTEAMGPGASRQWVRTVPVEAWDLCAGAASGAAAVLVSMPFDCIKTYMQTHGTDLGGHSLRGSARLFLQTGRRMVAARGMGSMYYGVVPRLLQQVPSSMMCWWAVHAVARALEPWTQK